MTGFDLDALIARIADAVAERVAAKLQEAKPTPAAQPEGEVPENADTKEAARYLGLRPQTLKKMRMDRRGPQYIKLGKTIRYPREALRRYKLEHQHGGSA